MKSAELVDCTTAPVFMSRESTTRDQQKTSFIPPTSRLEITATVEREKKKS